MPRLTIPLIMICALLGWVPARSATAAAAPRSLAIGYLVDGSDFTPEGRDALLTEALMEDLRRHLLEQPRLVEAMGREGLAGILLSPVAGPGDMLQRMRAGEFHLVLTTALDYGRFRQLPESARPAFDYEPMLQSRRPGDLPSGGGAGVLRRGELIMGPASPLFAGGTPGPAELRTALAASPLAVPSLDSAAGYVFPLLTLNADPLRLERPGELWFCGSDAEVVKHVVAGLAPFGACRKGTVASVLGPRTSGPTERFVKVLRETQPFPTDPILVRHDLRPANSDLGRELKPALRAYFNNVQQLDRELSVENAAPRDYERIELALGHLARLGRSATEVEAGEAAAQPAQAEPTPTPVVERPSPAVPNFDILGSEP